jgi:hypothetical protein
LIEGLRISEYTVSEVKNDASSGYVLPDDKKITVSFGATVTVEMHNTVKDTPKTGDDSNVGLWIVFAGASCWGWEHSSFSAARVAKNQRGLTDGTENNFRDCPGGIYCGRCRVAPFSQEE